QLAEPPRIAWEHENSRLQRRWGKPRNQLSLPTKLFISIPVGSNTAVIKYVMDSLSCALIRDIPNDFVRHRSRNRKRPTSNPGKSEIIGHSYIFVAFSCLSRTFYLNCPYARVYFWHHAPKSLISDLVPSSPLTTPRYIF